ncbi:VOC family protein [Amycolatopsis sp.]|uniref:VOC family protein n=1 Tax=Amycolatopsis sp. TaxID=37632 RepID=UPI002B933320|nr:VOC family protein [Amycolatopsis sp.]HVV11742.1 VOC family protein [Amycolatopsis sp.]
MPTNIFVNLAVADLPKSIEFFTRLGYSFNPQFTDDNAGCLVISDTIYAMLLTKPFFRNFTKKEIADSSTTAEAIIALSTDSREDVDALVEKALAAGGTEPREASDMGFMYSRAFEDLDGHIFEVIYMDPAHVQ